MNKRIERINNFRYPISQPTVFDEEELTVLNLVSKVAYKINETVGEVNNWFDYLDVFVEAFDVNLQTTVAETLTEWQDSGLLDDIINDTLQTQMDVLEDETNAKLKLFKTHLAEKADKSYVDTHISALASGSPKGVYETYAELQIAKPSGDSNIYIVETDGNWYYWNGNTWLSGGVYQSVLLDATVQVDMDNVIWEQGTISGGIYYPDTTRLRTRDLIHFNGKAIISVKTGYKFAIQNYENGVYKSQVGWSTTPVIIEYNGSYTYRFILSNINNSLIQFDAINSIMYEIELSAGVAQIGDNINNLKENNSINLTDNLYWELGSFKYDVDYDSDLTRIRTNFISFTSPISIDVKSGYKFTYGLLNPTTGKVEFSPTWNTDKLTLNPQTFKCRFLLAKENDGIIGVNEKNNIVIVGSVKDKISFMNLTANIQEIETPKDFFVGEINDTISKIKQETKEKSLVFSVLSDTHTYFNARHYFDDCIVNMKNINKEVYLDGIFHLGDIINGSNTIIEDTENIDYVRNKLLSVNNDVFFAFGNHDDISYGTHYADGDYLTKGESYSLAHRHNQRKVNRDGHKLYYYIDYPTVNLRIIVLDSISIEDGIGYDSADDWGYSLEQLNWVETNALDTDYNVLVFSHNPAIASMNHTNIGVANGTELTTLLENWQTTNKKVIAFISGHTHADKVDTTSNTFAHITIGTQHPTNHDLLSPNAIAPIREVGTVTQDLWDIMVIKFESRELKLIRFGSGEDRQINY